MNTYLCIVYIYVLCIERGATANSDRDKIVSYLHRLIHISILYIAEATKANQTDNERPRVLISCVSCLFILIYIYNYIR